MASTSFFGVPFSEHSFLHPFESNLWCGEAGAKYRDREGATHEFYGASIHETQSRALEVARFEVLERMLATSAFYSAEDREAGRPMHFLHDGSPAGRENLSELLIRQAGRSDVTASGLGLHESLDRASEHAVREMVERHLICQIWYGELGLWQIGIPDVMAGSYRATHFTIKSGSVPFCLSVITSVDESNPVFFCGSAVASNWVAARCKARGEALHLLTNLVLDRMRAARGNETVSREILPTLVGDTARDRESYFKSKVEGSLPSIREAADVSLYQCVDSVGLRFEDVRIARLKEWNGLQLVRAQVPGAWTKPYCRQRFKHVVPDPFC